MTRASISYDRKSKMAFIDKNVDSNEYQKTLETNLLPFFSISDTFQLDNALVHVSTSTKNVWQKKILPWPIISPD